MAHKDIAFDRKSNDKLKNNAIGLNKIIVRRLPPSIGSETFLQQVSPLPEFSYYYFVSGESSDSQFSRAYFCFIRNEDVIIFQERFDGYVFLDEKGNEYPAIVEYAPCNKVPKMKVKLDPKAGTIENDPDYLKFLNSLEKADQENVITPEAILEDIEAREKLPKIGQGCPKMSTPLIDFLTKKREDKKQAQLLKLKQREDERRKRQTLKEQNKAKPREKCSEESEQESQKDQDKNKFSQKPSKCVTSKVQIAEDPKIRERTNDREYYHKTKNSHESQKRDPELFRKGKGRYPFPKEKKDDECDTKQRIEKQNHKQGDVESRNQKASCHESPSSNFKDVRHESMSDEIPKKNKLANECQEKHDCRNKRDEMFGQTEKKDTESKGRIRYKDRPERAIYRPGQRKEKVIEGANP